MDILFDKILGIQFHQHGSKIFSKVCSSLLIAHEKFVLLKPYQKTVKQQAWMHTATTSGEIHMIVTSWFLRKKTKPVRVEIIPVKNKRRTQKSFWYRHNVFLLNTKCMVSYQHWKNSTKPREEQQFYLFSEDEKLYLSIENILVLIAIQNNYGKDKF